MGDLLDRRLLEEFHGFIFHGVERLRLADDLLDLLIVAFLAANLCAVNTMMKAIPLVRTDLMSISQRALVRRESAMISLMQTSAIE